MTKARRYKCLACGNLTRFDVIRTERVREFHHFTTGGELEIEDAERWKKPSSLQFADGAKAVKT